MLKFLLTTLCLLTFQASALADVVSADDIQVKVQKDGDSVVIDLSVTIPATPQEAWAVLVDFDHMPQFLNNLQSSKILEKHGNHWKVEQKGKTAPHAGFSISFEAVREVDLTPFETIHSHLISGTQKKHEGLTQLFPSGSGTRIVYHAESISTVWVPPLLGPSVIEGDVRKQFQDMIGEILKRQAAAKTAG
ncbi:MAG: SRPBCC family protein [Burkholderiaceae bacterium]|nr:SRPBCC family protein [Burkholderiaceae bacterium]